MITLNDYLYSGDTVLKILQKYTEDLRKEAKKNHNEIDLVLLFTDPNNSDPWEDQQVVQTLHLCDAHNVPMATNLATAEMLILGLQRGDLDWREMIRRKRSVR